MASNMAQGAGAGSTVTAALPLSQSEEETLRQYDRLQELKLEIALLRAQQSYDASKRSPATAMKEPSRSLPKHRRHSSVGFTEEPRRDPSRQIAVFTKQRYCR